MEDLFREAALLANSVGDAYTNWLDKKWPGKVVDKTHVCSNMCVFEPIDPITMRDALGCVCSGQLHLCGSNCDRSIVVDRSSRVCELTGRVLEGVSQSSSYTFTDSTVAFQNTLKNSASKRARDGTPKKRPPDPTFLKTRRATRTKTRKRAKTSRKRTKQTRKHRITTSEQERSGISQAVQGMMFHRDHIAQKRSDAAISSSTTAYNHFMRKMAAERVAVRLPDLVAVSCAGVPSLEGRKPIQASKQVPLVRKICAFLVDMTARALSHFRSTRQHIARCRTMPAGKMPAEIIMSQFDNASSHINAFQFSVAFLLHCCSGKKSKFDNRKLIPTISFLTLFAPRESDLGLIFEGDAHKTCLHLGWFMDFADQLFKLGLVPTDPALTPGNLFYVAPSTHGYESQTMMLTAMTTAKRTFRMEETSKKELPRSTEVIHVPPLTTEFATFLSEKGTTGYKRSAYWCLLMQHEEEMELLVVTATEIETLKDANELLMFFGTWKSRERAEAALQQWELDSNAVGNGLSLVRHLKQTENPDLKVYAAETGF